MNERLEELWDALDAIAAGDRDPDDVREEYGDVDDLDHLITDVVARRHRDSTPDEAASDIRDDLRETERL